MEATFEAVGFREATVQYVPNPGGKRQPIDKSARIPLAGIIGHGIGRESQGHSEAPHRNILSHVVFLSSFTLSVPSSIGIARMADRHLDPAL